MRPYPPYLAVFAYCSAGSAGEQVPEFKAMVAAFHQAGIEVILDVVYNHTAEAASTVSACSTATATSASR